MEQTELQRPGVKSTVVQPKLHHRVVVKIRRENPNYVQSENGGKNRLAGNRAVLSGT